MQFNLFFIQESLEHILAPLGYFYVPSNANKKRAKDFFESFPYFFYDIHFQNKLYEIIQSKPITSYCDSKEHIQEYCFFIYFEFSTHYGLKPKSKDEFYKKMLEQLYHGSERHKKWKQNNIQDYIFICLLIVLFSLYYFFA